MSRISKLLLQPMLFTRILQTPIVIILGTVSNNNNYVVQFFRLTITKMPSVFSLKCNLKFLLGV